MADDAEWTAVSSRKKPDPQPQATTPLTKAQLKNKRRAAKSAAEARALLTVAATDDSLDAIAAREALTARAAAGHAAEHEQSTRPAALGLVRRPQRIGRGNSAAAAEPHELVEAARAAAAQGDQGGAPVRRRRGKTRPDTVTREGPGAGGQS